MCIIYNKEKKKEYSLLMMSANMHVYSTMKYTNRSGICEI